MKRERALLLLAVVALFGFILFPPLSGLAEDSEISRQTLKGIAGVQVVVEDLQANILKYERYANVFALNKAAIRRDVEKKLKDAGIAVLTADDWQKTPGRPVLYVNINTHENEKYWFAYDVKVSLRQLAFLEARPDVKTLASTWSLNITGIANIGDLQLIRNDLAKLMGRFGEAWAAVNR